MGFKLLEADPATDFPAIARSMFDSYEDPPQPFFHAFFPIHGATQDAREEAIAECAEAGIFPEASTSSATGTARQSVLVKHAVRLCLQ